MGIQINGNTNNINAGIGSLSIEDLNELDIIGVATAANFKTGVSNLHDVGLTLSGGQIDVGSNIKLGNAGVITATSFSGDGSNLTGLPSQVTISNNADNRVITGGSGTNLNGEANLTFDGSTLLQFTGTTDPKIRLQSAESGSKRLDLWIDGGEAIGYIAADQSASQLAFRTTGNERLRITSAGLVGIGTDNPSYPLSVVTSSGKSSIEIKSHGTGANDDVFLRMRPAGTNKDCFIDFGDDDDADIGGIRYNHSNDFMAFTTNANERLRITSGGLVGINNTNPDRVLEVTKNDTACAKFGGAGGGSDFAIEIGQLSTSSSPGFNATGGSAMLFRNNGVESMRLIAGGAVVGFQTSTAADAKCVNVYTTGSNDGKYAMQIENGFGSAGGGNILKMKCARGDGTVDVDLVRLDLYNNTRIFSIDNSGLMRFRSGCGSGSQDALAVYGVRAWINFNSTSGNAIRGKGGLSGITDRGVGQFTFNFSTNMPDGNYTVTCNSGNQSSGTSNRNRMSAYSLTTSNFRIDDYDSGAGNTPGHADRQMIHVMVVR